MARGKCYFCGYSIKAGEGFITRYNGKLAHVGCLQAHIAARKKQDELLKQVAERKKRKFGGKAYGSTDIRDKKMDAKHIADIYRNQGYRARVVPEGKKWRVYVRTVKP